MAIEIRTITAELLRPGPRHNQMQEFGVPEKRWGGKYGVVQTSKRIAVILAGPKVLESGWRSMDVKIGPETDFGGDEGTTGKEEAGREAGAPPSRLDSAEPTRDCRPRPTIPRASS